MARYIDTSYDTGTFDETRLPEYLRHHVRSECVKFVDYNRTKKWFQIDCDKLISKSPFVFEMKEYTLDQVNQLIHDIQNEKARQEKIIRDEYAKKLFESTGKTWQDIIQLYGSRLTTKLGSGNGFMMFTTCPLLNHINLTADTFEKLLQVLPTEQELLAFQIGNYSLQFMEIRKCHGN